MSYFRHGDPLEDFDRLDREQASYEERLPVCEDCGEAINDDFYYEIDNEIICEECMKHRYRKYTENFIQIH